MSLQKTDKLNTPKCFAPGYVMYDRKPADSVCSWSCFVALLMVLQPAFCILMLATIAAFLDQEICLHTEPFPLKLFLLACLCFFVCGFFVCLFAFLFVYLFLFVCIEG